MAAGLASSGPPPPLDRSPSERETSNRSPKGGWIQNLREEVLTGRLVWKNYDRLTSFDYIDLCSLTLLM